MKNSILVVFSVIRNVDDFIKFKKDIDLFKISHVMRFKKSTKFYVENAKRIYNDIENRYYTLKELTIFLLYRYMMGDKKVQLYKVKPKDITETMQLFTTKRTKVDLNLLKAVYKEFKFKSIKDYFDLKEDGTNIAYILTIQGKISPVFFIKNFEKNLTNDKKDVKINKEYEQFKRIARKIKETLKRRFA